MYYIVRKGNELFDKLKAVFDEVNVCHKARVALLDELGVDNFHPQHGVLGGGISAIVFPDGNPDKKIWAYWDKATNSFRPKAKTEMEKRFENLPTVPYSAINDLINYDTRSSYPDGMYTRHIFCPGVKFRDEYILIAVHDKIEYSPVEHMEEILTSEYKKLEHDEKAVL